MLRVFLVMLHVFPVMLQVFRVMLHVYFVMLRVFRLMLQMFCVMLHVFPVTLQETLNTCNITRNTRNIARNTCNIKRNTCNVTRVRRIHKARITDEQTTKRHWHDVKVTSITADMENVVLTSAQRHCVYCVISQLIENKLKKIWLWWYVNPVWSCNTKTWQTDRIAVSMWQCRASVWVCGRAIKTKEHVKARQVWPVQ